MPRVDFSIVSGDTEPVWSLSLTGPDGYPLDLRGTTVTLHYQRQDDTPPEMTRTLTIIDALAGETRVDWQAGDTDVPGVYDARFVVSPGQISIPAGRPFQLYIVPKIGAV